MYIPEFWAGVIIMIVAEFAAILARNVAKVNMKKKGMVQFCKRSRNNPSYFSQHWREYVR